MQYLVPPLFFLTVRCSSKHWSSRQVDCLKIIKEATVLKITCFIEYRIDPFKLEFFQQYAENWRQIIPQCGGDLMGYFVPYEGTNNIAFGLISFNSLADYESYRVKLRCSKLGKSNFSFAQQEKFILEEKRTFLQVVPSTYKLTPQGEINDSGDI